MNETQIRMRVRQLLASGELPCDEPETLWAGNGAGKRCAACREAIDPHEVEYEVDLASKQTIRLHRRCHEIWLEECRPASAG
jgi:hypothetical protein